jgi:hypothetical protein
MRLGVYEERERPEAASEAAKPVCIVLGPAPSQSVAPASLTCAVNADRGVTSASL